MILSLRGKLIAGGVIAGLFVFGGGVGIGVTKLIEWLVP